MARCKWCGRTFAGAEQNGLLGGGYLTCSESCRLELKRSVSTGDTAAYRNPFESALKLLVKIFVVLGVCSYLMTKCGDKTTTQPEAATTTGKPKRPQAAEIPKQKARPGFGAPGQFELPPDAASEPAASEGEIRTIPAPEPAPAEAIPDSSGTS